MKKNKGADKFKLGQYGEASQIYQEIIEILQKIDNDFPLYKQEVGEMEATIYNNLAACAKKELNSKLEIEYTTKVIEREEHIIEDENTILKAYLRRGLAYE
jgi:tetratricopeptide (TPR) repeat protein